MSGGLSRRAVDRLLDVGAPLCDHPAAGTVDLERYELGDVLGRGGMGVVYKAFDRELGREVALKVLSRPAAVSEDARTRFLREARAAARLVHPHIATVYDATPEAIAMQRVRGRSLDESTWDDPRELVSLLRDAALAIHFAHEQGVIHRDLKPANLMVEPGDRPHVYVMDFGLAKESEVDSSLSASGVLVGTPAFMSPEQATGRDDEVGPATDVYGLGATLFACLAGHGPFGGPSKQPEELFTLLRRIAEEEAPDLRAAAPRVDRDLSVLVAKCLSKEPTQRYPSALALASDLDRWLRGEPIEARPPSLVYRFRRFVSRRQGVLGVAAAAVLVAVLVGLPFFLAELERRELVEQIFALSQRVHIALSDAATTRDSGVGHEREAWRILEDAIEECRSFLEQEDAGFVHFFLGRLLRAQGRQAEALAAFTAADSRRAGIPGLELERGLALAALYRDHVPVLGEDPPPELESWRTAAAEDLGRALEQDPDVPTVVWLFARGQRAWVEGDLESAIERHREVVERDVTHREAHLSLTRLYLLKGRDDLGMRHSVMASDLLRGHRPAYLSRGNVALGSDGSALDPARELLSVEGVRELLVDFHLLLQLDPRDANTYGMRGQVQLRRGLRAMGRHDATEARSSLEFAVREFDGALLLMRAGGEARMDRAGARLGRAVALVHLARLLSRGGESSESARVLDEAMADYDALCLAEPRLAVAFHDRSLAHAWRAQLAMVSRLPEESRRATEAARQDAEQALRLADDDHPWRWRFEALVGDR